MENEASEKRDNEMKSALIFPSDRRDSPAQYFLLVARTAVEKQTRRARIWALTLGGFHYASRDVAAPRLGSTCSFPEGIKASSARIRKRNNLQRR